MSVLERIKKCEPKAPRITIYGKPGVGKSTFASQFPKPLFLLTEQSGVTGVDSIEPVSTFSEFWKICTDVVSENHDYKTIVIDSISKLDQLVVEHVLSKEKNANKNVTLASTGGGYGAGYLAAQQIHRGFKRMLDRLQERGITVVYIAHVTTQTKKAPDLDDFDIYTITMNHDKSREIYIDDVDAVLFCKLKSFLTENDSGRNLINSTNERIIITEVSDAHICKNRFALPKELPMNFDALKKHIPFFNLD